ncbi:MAG TPA: F0F1 ATP synthase subunit A [Planctomycetia bacterium]|nr:F0F1 ATP synthase subunit A [Planctomycetia bacterium]
MAKEAADNPILHSTDSDVIHLPFHSEFNVFQTFGLSKFMLLNLVAAVLAIVLFWLLVRNITKNGYAKGKFFNFLEVLALYMRNEVAIPAIGKKDADRFLPLLWTTFFFILFGNLIGMLPWLGSPTGALGTTVAMALCIFIVTHGSGIAENGAANYIHSFVPPVPKLLLPIIVPIEIFSHLLRPCILAIRLFVNMLGGHTVLYVFLSFIAAKGLGFLLGWTVTGASVGAVVALSVLELFVAFLQAYVFTFLSALYIGGALHPHH